MNKIDKDPREPVKPELDDTYLPDMTPRREGGEDSVAESSPYDSRDDEKVVVNKQRENKMVNIPSQSAVNINDETSSDEEVLK